TNLQRQVAGISLRFNNKILFQIRDNYITDHNNRLKIKQLYILTCFAINVSYNLLSLHKMKVTNRREGQDE
ncbi:hypothetical protein, partial [Vibrio sp. V27_P1S3P104]|uniref:hypothetical protein n=1 Tax=Vibrio sp. V27_P1S3P104 TaxID=1938679 RepID=UPI003FCD8E89